MGLFDKLFGGKNKSENEPPKFTDFISSGKLMDEEQFWRIIKVTRDNSGNDLEQQQEE